MRVRPCVLIGRSMGGAIAMELALTHPERVRALVLVATAARFDLPEATLETWKNVMNGRAQQPFTTEAFSPKTDFAVMREVWMEQVKTDPRVRYTDLLACRDFDGGPLLARVHVPTLVVAGADDQVTPPALSEELARGIAGARLEVIPAAGHQAPLEQADTFNRLVGGFAAGLP
ncbi:MAG TPA: alpha/beta fold hydrolase, partial [Dongiaceae bacterium]|nr:alpha/beta fold hydrolase [Dongiaceae bacterium]